MNSFSIAYGNFKHNIKTYGLHLMAMIFSVASYYNFIALKFNPEVIASQAKKQEIANASSSLSVLLLVFLVFFVWISSSFFLNQRKKEFGTYAFMGVDNRKIAFIFSIEGFFLGLASIMGGLFIGALSGKLFAMLLAKFALLDVKIDFFVSLKGLAVSAVTFLIIFAAATVFGYIDVSRSRLVDLFNASRKEEGLPKVNYFKGIFSLILIGGGYYTSRSVFGATATPAIVTLVLVIWGTYWLFGSFYSIVMRYLINKKSILYNGVNIISLSNIAFRIKRNYRTLAAIAVLSATTITALGVASSLWYYNKNMYYIEVPYTFSYISEDAGLNNTVREMIGKSEHKILLDEQVKFLKAQAEKTTFRFRMNEFVLLKHSDFVRITENLKVENGEDIIEKAKPANGEATLVMVPTGMISFDNKKKDHVTFDGMDLSIKTRIKAPVFGGGIPMFSLIVNDQDYDILKVKYKEYLFNGIITDNPKGTARIAAELAKLKPIKESLFTYIQKYDSKYDFIGMVFFLGSFMALVFVIATGTIIYFKLVSEAFMDKEKYTILRKIGMDKTEITRAVSRQIGISFVLPLVVGAIHSIMAISVLQKQMGISLLIPTTVSIAVFAVIYGFFYLATIKKFIRIVCP